MKRSLLAALLAASLLGGTVYGANGGCPQCRTCFVPGWCPDYPKPKMYGGLSAITACQGGYFAPFGGYGYAPYAGYAPSPMGYGYGYGSTPPAVPATQKISTVPPPELATGSPK